MSEQIPPGQGGAVAGHRLADYVIEHELGRGGMAVVYLARDPRLDRPVALKVLSPELARDEAFRRRFIQESRAAAAVDHPNIIPVFDAGEADGMLYLAMRYVPGGDVRTMLDQAGPLPVRQACSLVGQVASALDAAHERGLIHRDVKPTNMLLEPSSSHSRPDHVYLADFGLAKQSVAATSLTMTGQFLGTVDYVAPEQIEGHALDGRADQYALACAVFEMLCGYPPFRREHAMAVISAQLSEPPPWLSALRPGVQPEIDQVLARAMAKSPDERYARCTDFAEALLAAGGPEAAGATPGAGTPGGVPPRPRTELASPAGPGAQAGAPALDATAPVPGAVAPGGTIPGAGSGGPAQPPGGDQPIREFPGSDPGASPGWWDDMSAPVPGPAAAPPQGGPRSAEGLGGRQFPPGQIGRQYPAGPGSRRPRRAGLLTAVILAVLVAGAVVITLMQGVTRHAPGAAATPPARHPSSASHPGTTSPPSPSAKPRPAHRGPASVVRAYVAAINSHRYARAWRLGGRNTGSSYRAFVAGFRTTAHDRLAIVSVSGHLVTGRITARQTNGSVHVYRGTYAVSGGVITRFHVRQVG